MKLKKNKITIVLITLNEVHNLERVVLNLKDFAHRIVVLDSYSTDGTVDFCIENKIAIYQRKFDSFGNQWNAALGLNAIDTEWVMKLDPDEFISDELKQQVNSNIINQNEFDGFSIIRRLFFLGKKLPVKQEITRIWRNGKCRFSNQLVNEYPIIKGKVKKIYGELYHYDSPNLEHWYSKQNSYTTSEAIAKANEEKLPFKPKIFGNGDQRRMFLKKIFYKFPLRYLILFFYFYLFKLNIFYGKEGFYYCILRLQVYFATEVKYYEIQNNIAYKSTKKYQIGAPDSRCSQLNN